MFFSIIVAFNNPYALMSNFLENLVPQIKSFKCELILFADGCQDSNTLAYISNTARHFPQIRLICSAEQCGYSIANNLAVKESSGDILVFMNSDVLPMPGSIEHLVEVVSRMPVPCAAQGRLIYPQNMRIQSTGHLFCGCYNSHVYAGKRYNDPLVLKKGVRQALTTAFCAMPRSVFDYYGGFDERYYNAYEGMELTLKITHDGGICLYCPECPAYHITGSTRNMIPFDDEMPGRYFWSTWKGRINADIQDYLEPQITAKMRSHVYLQIECGNVPEWPMILSSLEILTSGKIVARDRFSNKVDLYHNLPFSALEYTGPYLFTVNSMSTLQGNYHWSVVRNNPNDLIIDGHGNVIRLLDLTGADS